MIIVLHLASTCLLWIYVGRVGIYIYMDDNCFTFGVHLSTVALRRVGRVRKMLREVDRLIYFVRSFGWSMNIIGDRLIYFVQNFA